MSKLENDVQRSAREIGVNVTELVKAKITQAFSAGELNLRDQNELARILQIVDVNGKLACEKSLNVFYKKFDDYKASVKEDESPKK